MEIPKTGREPPTCLCYGAWATAVKLFLYSKKKKKILSSRINKAQFPMDLSLYKGSQILNEGCLAAVGALHNTNIAWDQGPLCMESPVWFRFRRTLLCFLLLHKGALEHPGEEESCHNSFTSQCKTQMTSPSQRATDLKISFRWGLKKKTTPQ